MMEFQNYKLDEHRILVPEERKEFAYSDGDEVEERLLNQLKTTRDLKLASDELLKLIQDWPSEYHFSPADQSPQFSEIRNFQNVLEVGSGCGAITRLLGEKGNAVFALEGSYRRAQITRERCRDLENVYVINESFDHFSSDRKFDLITLIGVLEYAPSFFKGMDPVKMLLEKAKELLKENGVMVVAIENQLGLKYFNACTEDHAGELFLESMTDIKKKGSSLLAKTS